MPSTQLADYLQARADGSTIEQACELSGIGMGEAKLHEADIERGDLKLPEPRVRARVHVHEAEPKQEGTVANGNIAADELRLLIERIERLREEIKGLNDDIRDIYAEAKSRGFDPPAMKKCIKLRTLEPHIRQEAEAILLTYMDALGLASSEASVALAA